MGRCGSPNRSTMNLVPQLFTESASKATILILPTAAILSIPPTPTTQHFTLLNSNLITNHSNKLAFFWIVHQNPFLYMRLLFLFLQMRNLLQIPLPQRKNSPPPPLLSSRLEPALYTQQNLASQLEKPFGVCRD